MKTASVKLNPFLRLVAVGMLFIWVAAVTACIMRCSCADSDAEHMAQNSAKGKQDSQGSDQDCNQHESFCRSLHSLTPASPVTVSVPPASGLMLSLNFLLGGQIIPVEPLERLVLRQPPDRQFVFTPEVSLGAAFRSLAPPSSIA